MSLTYRPVKRACTWYEVGPAVVERGWVWWAKAGGWAWPHAAGLRKFASALAAQYAHSNLWRHKAQPLIKGLGSGLECTPCFNALLLWVVCTPRRSA